MAKGVHVRILQHVNGRYEVQYQVSMCWGVIKFWCSYSYHSELKDALEMARKVHSERLSKTRIVYKLD